MKASVIALLQALDREIPGLDVLETMLRQQRDRLVARDVSGIIESIQSQEKLVQEIKTYEKTRRVAMSAVARKLQMDENVNLGLICDRLEGELAVELRQRREQLRQRVELVIRLNGDNQRLIRHAHDAVQKMAAAVAGLTPAQPVYEQNGLIRTPKQIRALVDQVT